MKIDKAALREKCVTIIQERIAGLIAGMADAQAAANEETKSSAGDKYETARAMSQLEKDMLARQLAENKKELAAMMELETEGDHEIARAGSLVSCKDMDFFILGGLGKMVFQDVTVFVISPNAPLAQSLMGKRTGDSFLFNRQTMEIREIS
jgi:transcription elongation GreA/GreB family factor